MKEIKPLNAVPAEWFAIFLAGSIEMGKAERWQGKIAAALKGFDILILNPRRDNWESLEERASDQRFAEQVEWELNGLERAQKIIMYFSPETKSPITLLELGLFAASGKLLVCCPDGFWRKGNVEIVCKRYNIPLFSNLEELKAEFIKMYEREKK
jgi:hypothetical protein